MNADAFVILVSRMRDAQKAYYNNGRKMSDLVDAKRLEKEVDKALANGIAIKPSILNGEQPEQPSLFPGESR